MNWLRAIKKFFMEKNTPAPRLTHRQKCIEDYLSKSVDRVDFERREREVARKDFGLW